MKLERALTINDPKRKRHTQVRVCVAVKVVATPGITVQYKQAVDERFDAAIRFGAAVTAERVGVGGDQQGLSLTVFFVEHQHIGPVMSAIAIVCARCVAGALGVAEDDVGSVDELQSVVRFPI